MITYVDTAKGFGPGQLGGFFEGWPHPPTTDTFLRILEGSGKVILAVDDEAGCVVGFITAVTDGVLAAYIPLLEVLPEHRGRGIGSELVRRMMRELKGLYMVDLVCDDDVRGFYERLGMKAMNAMAHRDMDAQCGRPVGMDEPGS